MTTGINCLKLSYNGVELSFPIKAGNFLTCLHSFRTQQH